MVHFEHRLNKVAQALGVALVQGLVDSLDDLLVEALHIFRLKGKLESSHLIHDAADGPHV